VCCAGRAQAGTGTANTALAFHNKQLLTLQEQDLPYAVRPARLAVVLKPLRTSAWLSVICMSCSAACMHTYCVLAVWLLESFVCARAQVRVHGDAHMETLERVTFGGRLDRHPTFTAHPKKDPDTGTVAQEPFFH